MTAVASLGMYDHPAQWAANDRIWARMADHLCAAGVPRVPAVLDRSRPVAKIWRDPALLFGQVCGYPLVTDAALSLRVLAVPVYAAPDCNGGTHCSVIVARRDDPTAALEEFRGRRAAINSRDSNTGMNLFRVAVAAIAEGTRFFGSVVVTGSHRESVRSIVAGDADIASIDAVTFAALARSEPDLTSAVRIVARTPASPTLPFVTGSATDAATIAALNDALAQVIADPGLEDARAALFLAGLIVPGAVHFDTLRQMATDAVRAGYPELA